MMEVVLDNQLLFGIDKQLHFFSYAILSGSIGIIIILVTDSHRAKRLISVLWMTLVSIGIIEEYRQYFVPDRSLEFLDAIANILGVTVGLSAPILLLYLAENRSWFLSKAFGIYVLMSVPALFGLILLNERPLFPLEWTFLERLRNLAALIGW